MESNIACEIRTKNKVLKEHENGINNASTSNQYMITSTNYVYLKTENSNEISLKGKYSRLK
jgi:hypothetical protein